MSVLSCTLTKGCIVGLGRTKPNCISSPGGSTFQFETTVHKCQTISAGHPRFILLTFSSPIFCPKIRSRRCLARRAPSMATRLSYFCVRLELAVAFHNIHVPFQYTRTELDAGSTSTQPDEMQTHPYDQTVQAYTASALSLGHVLKRACSLEVLETLACLIRLTFAVRPFVLMKFKSLTHSLMVYCILEWKA